MTSLCCAGGGFNPKHAIYEYVLWCLHHLGVQVAMLHPSISLYQAAEIDSAQLIPVTRAFVKLNIGSIEFLNDDPNWYIPT